MGEPQQAGAAASPGTESPGERADVILTPDQRVRVFISSTLGELAAERAAARRAITRLHLVPVWYESGARPHPPRSMYRAYLEQSQVFVGIYWQRYGWVAPGMEISGLEDEFQLAAGKPMLLYLKRPAPEQEPRLAAMIDRIRAAGTVSYRTFATARELERLLADDLAVLLSESFAGAAVSTEAPLAGSAEPGEADLPAGTVTFLFSDIEGSTRLVKVLRERWPQVLAVHRRLVRAAIAGQEGHEVDTQGDAFFVAFASAKQAVLCAVEIQRALAGQRWPEGAPVRVRIGIHTGQAVAAGGGYTGLAVHRAARICAAAHGGQVLVSQATQMIIADEEEEPGFTLVDVGEHKLKDLDRPVRLFQLAAPGLDTAAVPALRPAGEDRGGG